MSGTLGVLGGIVGGIVQHIPGGSVLRGVFIGFTVGFSAGLAFGAVSSLGVGASGINTYLSSYGTSQTVLADISAQLGGLIEARGGLAAVFAIATGATVFTADVILFGIYDVVRYINDEINSAHTTAAGVH